MNEMTNLQREIMKVLKQNNSTYANPVSSEEIGRRLNVNPSYVREQMKVLQKRSLVLVRNGPGGGYFLDHSAEEARNELS